MLKFWEKAPVELQRDTARLAAYLHYEQKPSTKVYEPYSNKILFHVTFWDTVKTVDGAVMSIARPYRPNYPTFKKEEQDALAP